MIQKKLKIKSYNVVPIKLTRMGAILDGLNQFECRRTLYLGQEFLQLAKKADRKTINI
jgi:hypothetical protein